MTARVHNEPDAVLFFRNDPEEVYGVKIFKAIRDILGIVAPKEDRAEKIDRANIQFIDFTALPQATTQSEVRKALQVGVHVFIQEEILDQFEDLVEEHRLQRIRDKKANLMWRYQVVPESKRSRKKIFRCLDADYQPGEEISPEELAAIEARAHPLQRKGLQRP